MAKLYFDVEANYKEAEKLTTTIRDLEKRINSAQGAVDQFQLKQWTDELTKANERLLQLVSSAAKSGAELGKVSKAFRPGDLVEAFREARDAAEDSAVKITSKYSSTRRQVKELNDAIRDNEKAIRQNARWLKYYQKQATKAYAKGDSQAMEDNAKHAENYLLAIQKLTETNEEYSSAIATLRGEEEKDGETKERASGIMEKLMGGTDKYRQTMALLPTPLKKVASGINGITKASLKFLATPLGLVVAALAGAFAALKSWFTKTEEGEMALAKATGYLKGVLIPLENIAIKIGKALYDAFNSPMESVKKLGQAIKTDITDRIDTVTTSFNGFIKFFKDIANGEGIGVAWDNLKETIGETPDAKKIQGLKEDISKVATEANEAGKAMAKIEVARKNLARRESNWNAAKAQNQVEKEALREIFQNTSLNGQWRDMAIDKYLKILEDEKKGDLGIAGEKVRLIEWEQSLSEGQSTAELEQLNAAKTAYANVSAEFEKQAKSIIRTRNAIFRQGLQEQKEMQKLEFEAWVSDVNNMESGATKDFENLMIQYQRRLDEIGDLAEQWRNKNGEALDEDQKQRVRDLIKGTPYENMSDDELFGALGEDQSAALKAMLKQALDTLNAGKRDLGIQVYNSYKSLIDQRTDLEKDYNDDMARLQEAYRVTGDEKFRRSMDERTKAYNKSLQDMESLTNGVLRRIFADVNSMTKDGLDEAIRLAQEKLKELYKTGDITQISQMRERLDALQNARDTYDMKRWGGSLTDLISASSRRERAEINRDSLIAQKTAEQGKESPDSDTLRQLTQDIKDADGAVRKLTEDEKKAMAAFLANGLGDTLGDMGGSIRAIGKEVGDLDLEGLGETLEGLGKTVSTVAQGFAQGGFLGGALTVGKLLVDKFKDAIVNQVAATARAKKAAEDYAYSLKLLSLQVEEMQNAFGNNSYGFAAKAWANAKDALEAYNKQTEKAIENMILIGGGVNAMTPQGRDYYREILKANGIIKENGELDLDNAQDLYDAKGITDKEFEKLKELKAAYDELRESVENYMSSLVGNSVSSIADEMLDKFLSTGSAIIDMTDNLQDFKRKLAKTVTETILFDEVFTEGAQKELTDAVMEGRNSDAIALYGELLEKANEQAGHIQQFLNDIHLDDYTPQSATAGGFQTMSQDTASELNGRFTALQISGEHLEAGQSILITDLKTLVDRYTSQYIAIDDIRNIQAQSLIELQGINENTLAALKPIKEMSTAISEIKTKVDRL